MGLFYFLKFLFLVTNVHEYDLRSSCTRSLYNNNNNKHRSFGEFSAALKSLVGAAHSIIVGGYHAAAAAAATASVDDRSLVRSIVGRQRPREHTPCRISFSDDDDTVACTLYYGIVKKKKNCF